jgi:hypothetical protein
MDRCMNEKEKKPAEELSRISEMELFRSLLIVPRMRYVVSSLLLSG